MVMESAHVESGGSMMAEQDSKRERLLAEVAGCALSGHAVHVSVHDVSWRDAMVARDVYGGELHVDDGPDGFRWVNVRIPRDGNVAELRVTFHTVNAPRMPGQSDPDDEQPEDIRDEQFDREAGWYLGWDGGTDAA